MTPKSEEELIDIVNNYDLPKKKEFLYKLYLNKFNHDKYKFFSYIRLMLGMSVWNRILKQIKIKPDKNNLLHIYVDDFISVFNKYEVDKLLKLMLKINKTTNESLRDQMKPISRDEVKNKLKQKIGVNDDVISILKWNPGGLRKIHGLERYESLKQSYYDSNESKITGDIIDIIEWVRNFVDLQYDAAINWVRLNVIRDKTNESIRNKMTPKSKVEILKSLNADPNATFERVNRDMLSSWLIGEINTTYSNIVSLFGEPKENDWIGNNFMWVLKSNNNRLISIYDNNSGLSKDKMRENLYKWHIGGTVDQDAKDLIAYIYKNTI